MALSQRIALIFGSLATLLFFISRIRKNRLKINHSIFWAAFGTFLLLLACVPKPIFWIASLFGFQSPSNLVYVLVIFLLVFKLFTNTVRLSKLNEQVTALTHALALHQLDVEEAKKGVEEEKIADLV